MYIAQPVASLYLSIITAFMSQLLTEHLEILQCLVCPLHKWYTEPDMAQYLGQATPSLMAVGGRTSNTRDVGRGGSKLWEETVKDVVDHDGT